MHPKRARERAMTSPVPSVADEIDRYLRTGRSDVLCRAWTAPTLLERAQLADADLTNALVAEVARRATGWQPPPAMAAIDDMAAYTRAKVEPMVRGLFPAAEHEAVLALLERSVVFVTPANIEATLRTARSNAPWYVANLYLGAIGAELLSPDAPQLLGISEYTTCYVSPAYFSEGDPFADFVVHEVAHIFHNCKRRDAGLREMRRKEWLLDIDFGKRETFAYACEAYSRVFAASTRLAERVAMAATLRPSFGATDRSVAPGEVAELVRAAAARRNGWRVILDHCSPPKPPTTGPQRGATRTPTSGR